MSRTLHTMFLATLWLQHKQIASFLLVSGVNEMWMSVSEHSESIGHRCQLVRFSRKSYEFFINWLAYGRTRQSLRIFTI